MTAEKKLRMQCDCFHGHGMGKQRQITEEHDPTEITEETPSLAQKSPDDPEKETKKSAKQIGIYSKHTDYKIYKTKSKMQWVKQEQMLTKKLTPFPFSFLVPEVPKQATLVREKKLFQIWSGLFSKAKNHYYINNRQKGMFLAHVIQNWF